MTKATDPPGNKSSHPDVDEQAYVEYGEFLREAVAAALGPWIAAQLRMRFNIDPDAMSASIDTVVADADARLVELIHADVDTPLSGPLERIRNSVEQLGPTLEAMGVAPPTRDPFDVSVRPNDHYGLGPIAFLDLGEDVQRAGITWGAAKAYLHRSRRK